MALSDSSVNSSPVVLIIVITFNKKTWRGLFQSDKLCCCAVARTSKNRAVSGRWEKLILSSGKSKNVLKRKIIFCPLLLPSSGLWTGPSLELVTGPQLPSAVTHY